MNRCTLTTLGLGASLLASCVPGFEEDDRTPRASVIYAPSDGMIPLPNDLLFSGSLDVTLNAPVADPTDFTDPTVHLNAMDGWSTVAPFVIEFDAAIDPTSVAATQTIRIFEVTTLTTPTQPVGGPVTGVQSELSTADFDVIMASEDLNGQTVRVLLNRPLAPETSYMVVVTNGILASDGRPLVPGSEYYLARQTDPYPANHPFAPLQILVNAMESAAEGAGVPRDSIVTSYTFTTQSIGQSLGVTRAIANGQEAAVIANLCSQLPLGCTDTSLSLFSNPVASVDTTTIGTTFDLLQSGPGSADLYNGELTIPYYQAAASNPSATAPTNDATPLSSFWQARYDFIPNDPERNLTRFNPLPLARSAETIPMILSIPNNPVAPPAGGWPVVIFQHGVTRNRGDMILIADALAAAGFAAVGIDMPLHGLTQTPAIPTFAALFAGYQDGGRRERTFGIDLLDNTTGAPGPDGIVDDSGSHYINLASVLSTRDNQQQAITDLFNLTVMLPLIDFLDNATGAVGFDGIPDFDANRIHFMGHSLGGIVGTSFAALEPNVSVITAGMPGSGLPKLLVASPSFGPTIIAGLGAQGVFAGTPEFEQFLWLAQTVTDNGDPANYAAALGASGRPVLLWEVVGGGPGGGLPDMTVPNSVAEAPLSGTDPLVALLNIPQLSMTTANPAGLSGVVRFVEGTHASLISPGATPAELAAFLEMQSQASTFHFSDGQTLNVSDPAVIQ